MRLPTLAQPVPFLTVAQMVEVDRIMIEEYGIGLLQMMENAGRNLETLACHRFLEGDPRQKTVIILAGSGGNGGGAMAAARHLHNAGASIQLFAHKRGSHFTGAAATQLAILEQMGVAIMSVSQLASSAAPHLIIDGIIGYSLSGAPRGAAAEMIEWANRQNAPLLGLDLPSGLDGDQGAIFTPVIDASATMTLALPKRGLLMPAAAPHVGELYLADISVPPQLYAKFNLHPPVTHIFSHSHIVRIPPSNP